MFESNLVENLKDRFSCKEVLTVYNLVIYVSHALCAMWCKIHYVLYCIHVYMHYVYMHYVMIWCIDCSSIFSNVSKYNYCFSDFPFPDDAADYPRHDVMANYVNDYVRHFSLAEHIRFMRKVLSVDKIGK